MLVRLVAPTGPMLSLPITHATLVRFPVPAAALLLYVLPVSFHTITITSGAPSPVPTSLSQTILSVLLAPLPVSLACSPTPHAPLASHL